MNMFNLNSLNQIIKTINNEPKSVDMIMARLPVNKFAEVPPFHEEVIRLLLDICALYVQHGNIREHLPNILQFYNKAIDFHAYNDDCNFALLEKLLSEYLIALKRESEFNLGYTYDNFLKTLYTIVHNANVPTNIIKISVLIFIIYIECPDRKDEVAFSYICYGMWKVSHSLELNDVLSLSESLICNTEPQNYLGIVHVYEYLIKQISLINCKWEVKLIEQILDCAIDTYEKLKDKGIRQTLSIALVKKVFSKSILQMFSSKDKICKVLYYMISEIFSTTPWESEHSLQKGTFIIIQFILNPDSIDSNLNSCLDLDLIVRYLELVYLNKRQNKEKMTKQIINRFNTGLPTNPAVLKSVYLLFAANVDYTTHMHPKTDHFQNKLLVSLHNCRNFESYLTYHVAQLHWILKYGSCVLKQRVVASWIHQEDLVLLNQFVKTIRNTGTRSLLLDIVCYHNESHVKTRAMDLFTLCCMKARAHLTQLLLRQDLTFTALTHIMEARPACIILGKPEDADYQQKLMTICCLIQRLTVVFTNDVPVSLETKKDILYFLYEACLQLTKLPEAECFVRVKFVKAVAKATKSRCPRYMKCAFLFLYLISTTQLFLKIELPEKIVLDPVNLIYGTNNLIKYATNFYLHVVKRWDNKTLLISMDGKQMTLYRNILEILGVYPGNEKSIIHIIKILLKRHPECVKSMINISAIRMHCRKLNTMPSVVHYIIVWCTYAIQYSSVPIPVNIINAYIKYLDRIKYSGTSYTRLKELMKDERLCSYKNISFSK